MTVSQPSVTDTASTAQEIWINVGRLLTRPSPDDPTPVLAATVVL
jgi:hypothetical protein